MWPKGCSVGKHTSDNIQYTPRTEYVISSNYRISLTTGLDSFNLVLENFLWKEITSTKNFEMPHILFIQISVGKSHLVSYNPFIKYKLLFLKVCGIFSPRSS